MTLGNVLALLQNDLKRLMAYSSVAHAGYMLVALAAAPLLGGSAPVAGVEAVIFYLVAYAAMTIGVFAVISYLSTPRRPVESVDDLAGLSVSHPAAALLMVLFLFSLIGMPVTAGFWGKFQLFFGAMGVPPETAAAGGSQSLVWFIVLVVIGVVNAAIGAWYYLRIAAAMYLRTPLHALERPRFGPVLVDIWICPGDAGGRRLPAAAATGRPVRGAWTGLRGGCAGGPGRGRDSRTLTRCVPHALRSSESGRRRVLERYPRLLVGARQPLGNRGGFSGARLWRLDGPAGPLCLRAWPTCHVSSHLDFIHHYAVYACTAGLTFVPCRSPLRRRDPRPARGTLVGVTGVAFGRSRLPSPAVAVKLRPAFPPSPSCTPVGRRPPEGRRPLPRRPATTRRGVPVSGGS